MILISLFLRRLEELILFLTLLLTTTFVFINVILRYFFSYSLSWPGEIGPYMLVAMTFVGSAAAVRKGAHIRIDIITTLFPGLKHMFEYIGDILFIIYAILVSIIAFESLKDLFFTNQMMISLRLPMYIPYSVVLLGAVLLFFRLAEKIIDKIRDNHMKYSSKKVK